MKKFPGTFCLPAVVLILSVLLTACSTVSVDDTQGGEPATSTASSASSASSPIAPRSLLDGSLAEWVPPLDAMTDGKPRALTGRFARTNWDELPGWNDDDLAQLWPAFVLNCKALMRPVSGALLAPARATPRAWQPVCVAAADPARAPRPDDSASIRHFLQTHTQPWRVLDAAGAPAVNTVTGYYEPLVHGSRRQGGPYQWPLYAVPDDLLTVDLGSVYPELAGKRIRGKLDGRRIVPYDTRADIAASPQRQPRALVWVNDPVDAFFLQIQGSGRVLLTDGPDQGATLRMAYADHNGRPYRSIGRWLADQGELPLAQASMQNIRAWAKNHPHRVQEMLNANPAMVFFREETIPAPELGPRGAYGVPLYSQRAIAVDARFVPLGAPVFLATTHPASSRALNRMVFAQDTGAAIQGAARADFYWGFGDEAGDQAGRMKQRGQMWVLWPRAAGQPSAR